MKAFSADGVFPSTKPLIHKRLLGRRYRVVAVLQAKCLTCSLWHSAEACRKVQNTEIRAKNLVRPHFGGTPNWLLREMLHLYKGLV